jgi:drug/metabolite transporter (DMT)-like permease
MPYLGEICALLTALCWTGSSSAFAVASRAVGPRPANQFRLYAALPCLLVLAWSVTGSCWPRGLGDERLWYLVTSGVAGLVLGDIGFFYALAKIGPRLSSVVFAAWPGMTVGIEAACGRAPTALVLVGIALTMLGVGLVLLRNRDGASWNPGLQRNQWWLGLGGALLGALGQAGGFLLAGYGMAAGPDLPNGVDPLHATVVRMATGVVGLQVYLLLLRQPFALRAVFASPLAIRAALLGALCGPVGGVWLSMVSRVHAQNAGVASALMATTPIFMMPVAWRLYGARVGWLGTFGTLLAVGGVVLCFLVRAA